MASLAVRRQSFNGSTTSPPKILIPTRTTKDNASCESLSPTLSVHSSPLSGNLSPEHPSANTSPKYPAPSLSGSFSPDLQATTPPAANGSSNLSPQLPSAQTTPKYLTPTLSGSLSPDLQPITPPVVNRSSKEVLQIGKYLLLEQLDSNVHKAVDTHTGQERICKVFTQETYRSKIAAYCRLYGTSSVVEIIEIIQGNKYVYVFFDKHYGDLHSYVRSKRKLKEEEAARLYQQIAQAVAQCHECGVVIRDLKLRKFVFTNPEKTRIQLEGLEDSHLLDDEENDTLCDKQGCPAYVSPEILERAQAGYSGKASDQWSSGVMLYTMLIGRYPFQEADPSTLFKKIKLGKYNIPQSMSSTAKCLIRNLLRREASERLTADEVLHHPWLSSSRNDSFSHLVSSRDFANDQFVPKGYE